MLNLSFNLKDPQIDKDPSEIKETPIICVIRYNAQRIKYYTREKIHPKHWETRKENKKYQRAKSSLREAPELNARLDKILTTIKNVFRQYRNDNNNQIPTPEILKSLLDKAFNRETETVKTFFSFFRELIDHSKTGLRVNPKTGKPIGYNTIKTYETTFKHLTDYQNNIWKKPINFESIDLEFYNNYKLFLIKKLKLANNSVGKHIQIIKLIMNEATERGLNTNLYFKSKRFAVVREKSDNIFLTKEEIEELEDLDLSNNSKLERVRDLFLIGCHTGLRYSDYSILKPEQIKDGFIITTQIKTGDEVIIPIHATVQSIIEKYSGNLPRSISNQKTNEFLKDLGKMVKSLDIPFIKSRTKGGQKVSGKEDGTDFKKWELLTTHTARRSFATNEYLAGTPTITIMAITGHKTERAFLKYIKLTPNEHAKLLKAHWEKRKPVLKAV